MSPNMFPSPQLDISRAECEQFRTWDLATTLWC